MGLAIKAWRRESLCGYGAVLSPDCGGGYRNLQTHTYTHEQMYKLMTMGSRVCGLVNRIVQDQFPSFDIVPQYHFWGSWVKGSGLNVLFLQLPVSL